MAGFPEFPLGPPERTRPSGGFFRLMDGNYINFGKLASTLVIETAPFMIK